MISRGQTYTVNYYGQVSTYATNYYEWEMSQAKPIRRWKNIFSHDHKITRSHNHSQIYCHPHQRNIAGQWALKQDHVWLAVIDPCWPIAHVATFANPWFLSDVEVARFANLSLNFESGYCLNRFDIFQNLWKIPSDHKRPCGNICKSLIFSDVKAKMSMWQFWNYVSFWHTILQWPFAGTITTKPQLPLEEFKKLLEVGSRLDIEGFQKAKGHCWSAALFKSEMSKLSFVTFKRLLMILPFNLFWCSWDLVAARVSSCTMRRESIKINPWILRDYFSTWLI